MAVASGYVKIALSKLKLLFVVVAVGVFLFLMPVTTATTILNLCLLPINSH